MKKYAIMVAVVFGISLATHRAVLYGAEDLAMQLAPAYVGIGDDEARRIVLSEHPGWLDIEHLPTRLRRETEERLQTVISLEQTRRFLEFRQKYVVPIKDDIENTANIIFTALYIFLAIAFLGLLFSNFRSITHSIYRVTSNIAAVARKIPGIIKLERVIADRELDLAEKEIARLNNFLANGLITNEQFEAKKSTLREKIKSSEHRRNS